MQLAFSFMFLYHTYPTFYPLLNTRSSHVYQCADGLESPGKWGGRTVLAVGTVGARTVGDERSAVGSLEDRLRTVADIRIFFSGIT